MCGTKHKATLWIDLHVHKVCFSQASFLSTGATEKTSDVFRAICTEGKSGVHSFIHNIHAETKCLPSAAVLLGNLFQGKPSGSWATRRGLWCPFCLLAYPNSRVSPGSCSASHIFWFWGRKKDFSPKHHSGLILNLITHIMTLRDGRSLPCLVGWFSSPGGSWG